MSTCVDGLDRLRDEVHRHGPGEVAVKPKPGPDHVIVVLPVGHGAAELPDGESEDVVDVDIAVAVPIPSRACLPSPDGRSRARIPFNNLANRGLARDCRTRSDLARDEVLEHGPPPVVEGPVALAVHEEPVHVDRAAALLGDARDERARGVSSVQSLS